MLVPRHVAVRVAQTVVAAPGRIARFPHGALGLEVDDFRGELAFLGLKRRDLELLGVGGVDRAIDLATVARSRLAPFDFGGGRAEMLGRVALDAAILMAAVIGADIEAGALVGAVDRLFPILAQRHDIGGIGGDAVDRSFAELALLVFLHHRARVGHVAEAVRAERAMRDENMRMHVAVIPPLARLVDRDIDGDAVALDDRREVIFQQLLALLAA